MGELFRWEQPEKGLAWTGERFVNGIGGDGRIEIEHLHRYFLAREVCRGKAVLDVASGEGYGSSLLAQTAERVLGVDSDADTVEHASRNYQAANLKFVQGSAIELPIDSNSLDVVVSFETLEHFTAHEQFFSEVRRVLRPDGVLLISTPDVSVYSAGHVQPNPFHMRELTEAEFIKELNASFSHVVLLRQRVIIGSAIFPDSLSNGDPVMFERRSSGTYETSRHLLRAPYLVALASNSGVNAFAGSVYVHTDELPGPPADHTQHFQVVEQGLRTQIAAAHEEGVIREAELSGKLAELRLQLADARRSYELARDETESVREQLKSNSFARQQQELVSRHLQRDLVQRTKRGLELEELETELANTRLELAARSEELARLSAIYKEVCNLIIPIWMRKNIPSPLKYPLRAIKRVLRNG